MDRDKKNSSIFLSNLLIDIPGGQKIPLAQVVKVEYGNGPSTIDRENVSKLIIVFSNVAGRDLGSVIADVCLPTVGYANESQRNHPPPLAVVVLGGLFTSTALTLLVLPDLYALFGKFIVKKRSEQTSDVGTITMD